METQKKRSAVQPEEAIAHLRVLAVFHKLKLDVQARSPHNPTGLWTAFLGYAVEKFASWISNVVDKDGSNAAEELADHEFPTIDVAMHPLEYHNDCQKRQRGLKRIKSFPIKRLAEVIDTLGLEPRFPVPAFGSRGVRIGPQFSLDLVAAVKRQASFIAQVAAVGWTQRPKGIEGIVGDSIEKYHCFLRKIWENHAALAVPTLEIDLAWHTHQLNIDQYRQDSMMLFGRILQHDDDIPSPELNKAFNRNSYDWKNLFHMDYSSASICTGFRPIPVSAPGTPTSMKRAPSRDSIAAVSEMSLSDLYRSVSERRLSLQVDSTSTSASSRQSSSPSPSPSQESRPSSTNYEESPPRQSLSIPSTFTPNDSTTTISQRPSSSGFNTPIPSPFSSTSDLDSVVFAYTPPKRWNDARGAFDRPPPCLRPSSTGSTRRPQSAGSGVPSQNSLRGTRHRLSNSTGALYAPETSSPLSQVPEVASQSDHDSKSHASGSSNAQERKKSFDSAQTRSTPTRRSGSVKSPPPSSFPLRRSTSSGGPLDNPSASRPQTAPSSSGVSKRPSTGGGDSSIKSSGSGSASIVTVFRMGSRSRPVTPESGQKHMVSLQSPHKSSDTKRPTTAPQPDTKASLTPAEDKRRSSGIFGKKSKAPKELSKKRSWFKLW
ncbi:hypothetical protein CPB86DRAFT_814557 [Serendipita vermifera]|nr:hypothetical protein CPB86DRAFT_814557 [Serendipita vermifera]